jgi:hypothetical protein
MGMKVNGTSGLTFPDTTTLASAGQASVRAWVNFNGTGTVAIRASYNVTSITDNGTGDYTLNFTTALPDADYAVNITTSPIYGVVWSGASGLFSEAAAATEVAPSTTSFRFGTRNSSVAPADVKYVSAAIFR